MSKAEAVDLGQDAIEAARTERAKATATGGRYRFRGPYTTEKRRRAAGESENSRSNVKIESEKAVKTDRDFTKKPLKFNYFTKNVVNSVDDHFNIKYNSTEIKTEPDELEELAAAVQDSLNELLEYLKFSGVNMVWFIVAQFVLVVVSFTVKKWFQVLKVKQKFEAMTLKKTTDGPESK